DPQASLTQFQMMLSMMGAGADPSQSPIAQFEAATGVSVQNDVVPALGQEVVFSLNSLGMNPIMPMVPMVDLALGAEVKDEAKMREVMGKLEKV
ncbi:hypothetical protein, partial [Staphylococcus aureus]|uniref:hypothetical protein n=1 Tax=Staphylococcus aureus TaxID=1280 RepID=UPI00148FD5D4